MRDQPGAFPIFLGLNVERRERSPKKTDWESLDLTGSKSPYLAVMRLTGMEAAQDSRDLDRPPGQGAGDASSSFGARSLSGRMFAPSSREDSRRSESPGPARLCPIRFLDVTIEPAKTYEYRVQVRMANPNCGKKTRVEKESLAEPKELLGPWTRVPGTATMAPDMLYYAVDAKRLDPKFPGRAPERDEVALQVHRWFGMYEFTRGTKTDYFGVGACVIAERVLARRGEFIGVKQEIKLPVWDPVRGRHIVAGNPLAGGVEVNLTPNGKLEGAPLLVDFQGGKVTYHGIEGEAPVEVVMLSPDGKLMARNSQADTADPERQQREADWKKWLRDGTLP